MACLTDATAARLLDGGLSAAEAEGARAHLDECADCRQLVAGVLPRTRSEGTQTPTAGELPPRLPRGAAVGRYLVLGPIGAGAMGVVYAAYDPELERKIALKLIRAPGDDGASRTLREAQAMARLSHPNVVSVFDVGAFGAQLFVAMELVEGGSLRAWLGEAQRTLVEVVRVLVLAGRGLQAAHEAGLVHRDFKPDNVLVGQDGRVRVTDFGLARREPAASLPADLEELRALHASPPTAETRPGAMVGSPAYMAPEQLRGEPADARADQFAFCVTLFEALYGARPFGGQSLLQLNEAAQAGRIDWPPRAAQTPAWLRRILVRGLSAEPAQRFASMAELLGRLDRGTERSRRRWLVAGGLALAAAIAVPLGIAGEPCAGAEKLLGGVWDGPRKGELRLAFERTGAALAGDAFAATERALDSYAAAWATGRRDACLATAVRREQSAELLDLRMQCLDQRRRELQGLVEVMLSADKKLVARAAHSASQLSGLELCANVQSLRQRVLPPADAGQRARIARVREKLARAQALYIGGRYPEALQLAAPLADEARGLYRPLEAEVLYLRGRVEHAKGDARAAAQSLRAAVVAAAAGREAEVGANANSELAVVVGDRLNQPAEGRRYAELSAALVESVGGNQRLSGRLERTLGIIDHAEGKYDAALAHYQTALAIFEALDGPAGASIADAHNNIGEELRLLGKREEAVSHHELAVRIWEKVYGPNDSRTAVALNNLGADQTELRQTQKALASFQRVLAIREKLLGPEHPDVAVALANLAEPLIDLGRLDEAEAVARRSLAIKEKALGPGHPSVAFSLVALAEIDAAKGQLEEGERLAARAVALRQKAFGAEGVLVTEALVAQANLLRRMGRAAEALEKFQQARLGVVKVAGAGHPAAFETELGAALVRLELRRPREALPVLERLAAELAARKDIDPYQRTLASFGLARALVDTSGDRARAAKLARQAQLQAAEAGFWGSQELPGIGRLLAQVDER